MDDPRIEMLSNRIEDILFQFIQNKTKLVLSIKTIEDKLDKLEKDISLIRNHLRLF
jgi:hypothetical protein